MSFATRDYRRLRDEADIRRVIDECRVPYGKKMGIVQYVLCPNPTHNDTNPTNAYFKEGWNTVYCTTCNKNMSPIDIIMWSKGVSFGEAADILWELEGRPSWYHGEKKEKKKSFHVSHSDLTFLGLKFASSTALPLRYTKSREMSTERLKRGCMYCFTGDGYVLTRSERIDWSDFISRRTMRRLIIARCQRLTKELDDIEARLGASGLFVEERERIKNLRAKAGGRT